MTIARNLSFLAEGVSSTGVLGATYGGTGQSSITTGDLLYGSASNTISKLGIGSTGTILRVVGGVPTWGTDYTGTVTSVAASVPSFLSISGSPITTSGTLAITYSGIALPTANGGTALTSFTANGVLYASSSSVLATSSAITFDGSNLSLSTSQNSATKVNVTNSNGGTSAVARYEASNGSNTAEFGIRGTSQTNNGVLVAQATYIYSPSGAGLSLCAAAGPIYFASSGTTEVGKFDSNGNFTVGTSSGYSNAAFTTLNVGGSKSGKVGFIGLFNASDSMQATIDTYGNQFRFSTNGTTNPILFNVGGSVTTAMEIFSSGGVSIGNTTDPGATNLSVTGTGKFGTTIGVGATTPASSGAGITFPATQSQSSNVNTLDDYEEGYGYGITITPETSGTITLITNFDVLAYTKIGRLVTVQGQLKVSSVSSPIGTYVKISLPFAIATLDNIAGRFGQGINSDISGVYALYPITGISGDSFVSMYCTASTIVANKSFFVSFSYITLA